jgi:peptidyl-tRNA hydrolase
VVADFVLSSSSKNELYAMQAAFDVAVGFIWQMVAGDMSVVMNKLNSQKLID